METFVTDEQQRFKRLNFHICTSRQSDLCDVVCCAARLYGSGLDWEGLGPDSTFFPGGSQDTDDRPPRQLKISSAALGFTLWAGVFRADLDG